MTAPTRRRVLPAHPRLQARARADHTDRRRRRLRRGALLVAALVPVGLLAWLLLSSPLLSVHRVQVVGADRLDPQAVRAVAAVPLGVPLARVDTDAVRGRVAELPAVDRVRAVRAWPRTLRVVVVERTPVASTARPDGSWALVDGEGVVFAPLPGPAEGLPQLQVAPDQTAGPAVRVLAELPPALRASVAAAQTPSPSSVLLRLRDGRAIVWGPPGSAARKAAVVAALLPRPGRTLDVTSPEIAVVR